MERAIPLGGVEGRIVAALGNRTLGVIDLGSARVLQSISMLKEPQGIAHDHLQPIARRPPW